MFKKTPELKKLHKYLDLDKPLVVFDIEATGIVISTDRIVELAYIKLWGNGKVRQNDILLNPETEISPEATQVHGITDEDVRNMPRFRDKAQEIWETFNDCYYGGHNIITFDLPLLRREFIRVGMDFDYDTSQIIDSRVIFQHMVPRSLSAAHEYYCGREYKQAHRAANDVAAAAKVLARQMEVYREARAWDFINDIHDKFGEELYVDNTRKFYWLNGEAYFAFSEYRDKPLAQVAERDPKFLEWILSSDFSDETKLIVRKALEEHMKNQ